MKTYMSSSVKKVQYSLLFGDILILLISIILSYYIKMWSKGAPIGLEAMSDKLNSISFVVVMLYLLPLYLFDQYDLEHVMILPRSMIMLIFGIFISGLLVSGLLYFMPKHVYGREVLLIHFTLVSLLMLLWRSMALSVLRRGLKAKRLALVGHGKIISSFIEDISHLQYTGLELKTVCIMDKSELCVLPLDRWAVKKKGLTELLKEKEFDVLAFDSTNGHFSSDEIREILQLKFQGKTVRDLSNLYENLTGKVPVTSIDDQWLLKSPEFQRSDSIVYKNVKRILDVIMAWFFLLVTSPLFVLIALLIKLESTGPVFFVQERLGVDWKPFRCFKFRTMVENAENESGPVWATESDTRITRVGRILRKARLDELPQLWNIIKGEMTFVGPRPIREHFAKKLAEHIPFYELRFCVKPGLTGWAQVNYDYAGSEEGQLEKFQYDLFYIRKMSLTLDLLALFKTFKTVVKRVGT
jgi:exopolysaccharide biosynthesis polyprenyl glycosylphosphotransferase